MEKKEIKPKGYWTYERCKEESNKYSSISDFQKGNRSAYHASWKNGWLNDFGFKKLKKPKGYWDKERCYEEASKYETRTDFGKGNASAYYYARINEWLDDYYWFVPTSTIMSSSATKWTKEMCEKEALKYASVNVFRKKSRVAYDVARKNSWLGDYYWLDKSLKHEEADYWVYAYEDVENKAVYVGLTFRKRRHREHLKDETDTVKLYFESINKPVPEQRIKMDGLNAIDAQNYEDWYKQKYAEAGWKVLNKGETGIGVGSLGSAIVKWDYNNCKEEATKYKTRCELYKNNGSAYDAARRNGWLDEFYPPKKMTYEYCKEEAMKYKSRNSFNRLSPGAYEHSRKNGWLDDFYGKRNVKPDGFWCDYNNCKEEASKYRTKVDFQKFCASAYHAARRNGWLDEWFENQQHKSGYWNYDHCKEESLKYASRGRFKVGCETAYHVSRKNGWLDEFFPKAA